MSVRVGRMGDFGAVVEVERAAGEAPHWEVEAYRRALGGDGDDGVRRRVFVWEEDGGVRGFAVGAMPAGDGELESVAVAAGWRRMGIGQALCLAVVGWCGDEGAAMVRLEVRASSLGAIGLYEGLGFRLAGRRRGYYGEPREDALLMELALVQAG